MHVPRLFSVPVGFILMQEKKLLINMKRSNVMQDHNNMPYSKSTIERMSFTGYRQAYFWSPVNSVHMEKVNNLGEIQ